MSLVQFPYGREMISCDLPETRLQGVLHSQMSAYVPEKSEVELVRDALAHPIGSPKLSELVRGKKRITLIASDHTRPVPSKIIIPEMLREIREGNPDAEVTFLIATGCHRETSLAELTEKFGEEIVQKEKIVVHDCDDTENLVSLGTLPSGGELIVNRLIVDTDLLISEGFIEPHFFAGFSGGRKSVLPGVCSRSTVIYNHNAEFIDDPHSRTGIIEGNPIHKDMLFAARTAKLAFICNVVINSDKKVVYAVAGDADEAHIRGREFLKGLCGVSAKPSDIVITTNGGYPLDQNIYQAVKGMTAAEPLVKEQGITIMMAKCNDGDGGAVFHETFRSHQDLPQLMAEFLSTPPEKTIIDQWQSQIFARVLMHSTVIFVSDADDETVRDLHMIPAKSLEDALSLADSLLQSRGIQNGTILAIPDGVSVISSPAQV